MKIDIKQIPFEGISVEETVDSSDLDLETEIISFCGPIKIKADISKITNAVTVDMVLNAVMRIGCSRCLKDSEIDFEKKVKLNYFAEGACTVIDLNPDIREEIILDYPIKPLCSIECKGLCPKCGSDLNKGPCGC